jgi:hypothetical protein
VAAPVPEIMDTPEKLENNNRTALIAVTFFTNSAWNMRVFNTNLLNGILQNFF